MMYLSSEHPIFKNLMVCNCKLFQLPKRYVISRRSNSEHKAYTKNLRMDVLKALEVWWINQEISLPLVFSEILYRSEMEYQRARLQTKMALGLVKVRQRTKAVLCYSYGHCDTVQAYERGEASVVMLYSSF